MSADLAVIDPETDELIALFEVMGPLDEGAMNKARDRVLSFLADVDSWSIPVYLTFVREGTQGTLPLEFREVGPGGRLRESQDIPEFTVLAQRNRSAHKTETREKRKRTLTTFHWVSWLCALLVLVVLLADMFTRVKISEKQLVVLGVFVALILIPYMTRIKVGEWLELERPSAKAEEPPSEEG